MLRFLVICAFLSMAQSLTPSSFLSANDKTRLKGLFETALQDPSSVSHAVLGLKILGETLPADLCSILQANIDKADVNGETIFAATSAAKALDSCALKPNAQASQVRQGAILSNLCSQTVCSQKNWPPGFTPHTQRPHLMI